MPPLPLPTRATLEARISKGLNKKARKWYKELITYVEMTNPPSHLNVPFEFWGTYEGDLKKVLEDPLYSSFLISEKQLLEHIPVDLTWDLMNRRAYEYATGYGYDLVKGISTTTKKHLQASVGAYFSNGESLGQLRQRIEWEFSSTRAEMIARTEVTRAASQGELKIAQELAKQGYHLQTIWQTSADEFVCPICGPRHNQVISESVEPPPAHPRCRCWLDHQFPDGQASVMDPTGEQKEYNKPLPPKKKQDLRNTGVPRNYYESKREAWEGSDFFVRRMEKLTGGKGLHNYENAPALKDSICKRLAERTGIPYEDVNDFIHQWAFTSNDNDMRALTIQQRAAKLFDVPLQSWQKDRIEDLIAHRDRLLEYEDLADVVFNRRKRFPLFSDKIFYELEQSFSRSEITAQMVEEEAFKRIDKLLLEMYKMQQEGLQEMGIGEYVTLFRGINIETDFVPGQIVEMVGNPLESWSYADDIAGGFGDEGLVLVARIPRERIIGSAMDGFGCFEEGEFVVIGNPMDTPDIAAVIQNKYFNYGDPVDRYEEFFYKAKRRRRYRLIDGKRVPIIHIGEGDLNSDWLHHADPEKHERELALHDIVEELHRKRMEDDHAKHRG